MATKIPLTTDLALGEAAINTRDGKLFLKRTDGTETDTIRDFISIDAAVNLGLLQGQMLGYDTTAKEWLASSNITNMTIDDYTNHVHADATHLRIKATSTLIKGQAVRFTGYNSGEEAIEVTTADNTVGVSVGITVEPITIGNFGNIISNGIIENVDTGIHPEGTILYVSTGGALTATEPTTGFSQPIAYVLRQHAINGAIMVNATYPKQDATDVRYSATETVADVIDDLDLNYVKTSGNSSITAGDLTIDGALYATSKSFRIPHPTEEDKQITYGSLEGPENGVYVRGRCRGGEITLPDYWEHLIDPASITVTLTPVGNYQELYVKSFPDSKTVLIGINGMFNLRSSIDCYYTVTAERSDIEKLKVITDGN